MLKLLAASVAHGELSIGITGKYYDIVAFYRLKQIAIMCDQVASGLGFGRPGYIHPQVYDSCQDRTRHMTETLRLV